MADSGDETSRWEGMWSRGLAPGDRFDCKGSSPALKWAIERGLCAPTEGAKGPAVVPGCGRGYDVETLSRVAGVGRAVGVELSTTATSSANEYLLSQSIDPATGSVVTGNLFTADPASLGGPFSLAYDYTCFCAIPPARRADWAAGYARLLRQGGRLVCLQFPLDTEGRSDSDLAAASGPPYPVSDSQYDAALLGAGFRKLSRDVVPEELSHPGRGGREALAVYERAPASE